jgi:hypothetical protein
MNSALDSSVSELHRRARHCRRLSNGAVPQGVMQELAAFASDYESEADRLECQRRAGILRGRPGRRQA